MTTKAVAITVVYGFERDVVADLVTGLLLHAERVAAVWVEPFTAELGYLQTRVSDSDGRCTEQAVPLEHNCLSCTLRAALAGTIRRLHGTGRYDTIVVHVHPGVDVDRVVRGMDVDLGDVARVDTVATAIHSGWLDQLGGAGDVGELGIAVSSNDDRSAAMLLAAALDESSVLVFPGRVGDGLDIEQHGVLSVLCPDAVRLFPRTSLDAMPAALLATASYRPRTMFAARGLLDPQLRLPAPSGALEVVRWRADERPLHPARLRAALDGMADGVIRSVGHLHVASHPDTAVHWCSAGDCLCLGPAAAWPDERRPSRVSFLGEALDADMLRRELDACLLTDAELIGGPAAWARLENPFVEWPEGAA